MSEGKTEQPSAYRKVNHFMVVFQVVAIPALVATGWLLHGMMSSPSLTGPPADPMRGPAEPPTVVVEPVREGTVESPQEFVGHVEALQTVNLVPQVAGYIEEVHFEEGSLVEEGDPLFTIQQDPFRARVALSEAALDRAKSTLPGAEADLDAARASFERSKKYLKRLQNADERSVVKAELDMALADFLQTQARVKQAEAAIPQAEAAIHQAEADLELRRIDLAYTEVRAPIKGRIGKAMVTKGNYVDPASSLLARIVQMDPVRVVYSISENDLVSIQAAMNDAGTQTQSRLLVPQIKLADGERYPIAGQVDFADNQIDPATGSIAVWAKFDNSGSLLIPGQYVTALVAEHAPKVMPLVPQAAVMVNQQGRYVLVVDSENRAVARPITIGPVVGAMWAVESGLEAGERIIVQGIQKVTPDQTVQISSGEPEGR